jgi:hypothetical protein
MALSVLPAFRQIVIDLDRCDCVLTAVEIKESENAVLP